METPVVFLESAGQREFHARVQVIDLVELGATELSALDDGAKSTANAFQSGQPASFDTPAPMKRIRTPLRGLAKSLGYGRERQNGVAHSADRSGLTTRTEPYV
jgi:hypothetical protein